MESQELFLLTNDWQGHTSKCDLQMAASQTADYKEGVAAFLEKRKPVFRGE